MRGNLRKVKKLTAKITDKNKPMYIVVDTVEDAEKLELTEPTKVYIRSLCSPEDWPDPEPETSKSQTSKPEDTTASQKPS